MNIFKKIFIRTISGVMPTQAMRRDVRNVLTIGFGKTHYRGKQNNKIIRVDKNGNRRVVKRLPGCNIYFYGSNNLIEVHEPLNALQISAQMYGDSKIVIKSSKYENRKLKIQGMTNCTLTIEEDFYVNGQLFLEFTENTNIKIGQDCMFSYDIIMRTGDGHKIFSTQQTNERINPNEDIIVGNHVWVACKAIILKGAIISNNSIVGACSLVNKKFYEENVILAGTPAVIKKRDILWER